MELKIVKGVTLVYKSGVPVQEENARDVVGGEWGPTRGSGSVVLPFFILKSG